VPLLCRSLPRRPTSPQPPLPSPAMSCRGPGMPVPRARHGNATALISQDPRACVHTHAERLSRVPASPCHATTPPWPCHARRPRDTAATSRSRRGQAPLTFPRAPTGCTPHTLALTHTHGHPKPKPHRIWQPHQIRWETNKRVHPVGGSAGRCPLASCRQ
jgi:hypothetical protein